MKKRAIIGLGLLVGFMAVTCLICFAGAVSYFGTAGWTGSKSVDQHSSELPDDSSKIAFLKTYLHMESEIEGAEFHIQFQDNSRGLVPGPSDLHLDVVMKMAPIDVPRWTAGLTPAADEIDLTWGHDLLRQHNWTVNRKPTAFVRGRTIVAAFQADGVVFKRVARY
jgi:hypothetical protein